jgi:transposase
MAKSTRQRAHPQGTNARNAMIRRPAHGVVREAAPDLSRDGRRRLAMVDWHRSHGGNVSLTARHFGVGRSTVYRWLARFDRLHLETLEDRGSAPRRRRRPTWTVEQLGAVRALRERYPRWGKDKLRILLRRAGIVLSTSMIGRILARLLRAGDLREPRRRRISARKRAWRRPHAVRKPKDFVAAAPGDLVQVDTLDVRPLPGEVFKQFTARDVVSRWDVLELRTSASSRSATAILDALAERMPFRIRALSVDNGSEFIPRVRGRLCGPGDRPPDPATPEPQAQRQRRAGQPNPHRGVLRGDRRRGHARRARAGAARVGDDVQHDPPAPGLGLSHAGRIPRLDRHRYVSDVLNEYTRLT